MPFPLIALATVGRVAATAARVGSVAARAGSTAARAGAAAEGAAEGAASAASRTGSLASSGGRALSTASRVARGARAGSHYLSDASHEVSSLGRGQSSSLPQGTNSSYAYGHSQPSPQFMNADPHYGMPTGAMHSGYSGLDSAEATTGAVMRRDDPPRPLPLNSSTISTMGRAMAWHAPNTLIGKGAQGSFYDFGEQVQGSPYRPQGG